MNIVTLGAIFSQSYHTLGYSEGILSSRSIENRRNITGETLVTCSCLSQDNVRCSIRYQVAEGATYSVNVPYVRASCGRTEDAMHVFRYLYGVLLLRLFLSP